MPRPAALRRRRSLSSSSSSQRQQRQRRHTATHTHILTHSLTHTRAGTHTWLEHRQNQFSTRLPADTARASETPNMCALRSVCARKGWPARAPAHWKSTCALLGSRRRCLRCSRCLPVPPTNSNSNGSTFPCRVTFLIDCSSARPERRERVRAYGERVRAQAQRLWLKQRRRLELLAKAFRRHTAGYGRKQALFSTLQSLFAGAANFCFHFVCAACECVCVCVGRVH